MDKLWNTITIAYQSQNCWCPKQYFLRFINDPQEGAISHIEIHMHYFQVDGMQKKGNELDQKHHYFCENRKHFKNIRALNNVVNWQRVKKSHDYIQI